MQTPLLDADPPPRCRPPSWMQTPLLDADPSHGCRPTGGKPPWRQIPLDSDPTVVTSSGGHCNGRYASYWNAFLLLLLNWHCHQCLPIIYAQVIDYAVLFIDMFGAVEPIH